MNFRLKSVELNMKNEDGEPVISAVIKSLGVDDVPKQKGKPGNKKPSKYGGNKDRGPKPFERKTLVDEIAPSINEMQRETAFKERSMLMEAVSERINKCPGYRNTEYRDLLIEILVEVQSLYVVNQLKIRSRKDIKPLELKTKLKTRVADRYGNDQKTIKACMRSLAFLTKNGIIKEDGLHVWL